MKFKTQMVYILLSVIVVLSLALSTLSYRGLYLGAIHTVGSLEKDLSEARRSLQEAVLERDTASATLNNTSSEVKRVDQVVTKFEEKAREIAYKREEGFVSEKVVIVDHISDELNSLLTESYNEIFLQDDTK